MRSLGQGITQGLATCLVCHQVVNLVDADHGHHACPRCHAEVYFRKHNSLAKCGAYLLAAFLLYIPANIFPIMTLVSFARESKETILSGVYQLVLSGQWGIAFVVFFASIVVPIFKIFALGYLALSVRQGAHHFPLLRTRLYRFVEWIGRWSMIDIFMISILIALVRFREIATIEVGPGALAFAAVVVLTMLAANAFDPRLIWDQQVRANHE
ncbi:paraquat-inducible protein A [Sneathiella limimaris]|uniref:paraquat-inducible protein A n=1 Tax=Sneathiella limimaris TaxID=1964213 RepID=UPI00146B8C8A|nr:paraquat-inducible protein A [Sneathiella limimaris]